MHGVQYLGGQTVIVEGCELWKEFVFPEVVIKVNPRNTDSLSCVDYDIVPKSLTNSHLALNLTVVYMLLL